MKLNIITKEEMKALPLTRIEAELSFENSTPTNKEIQTELSKQMKVKEELIQIKHIYTDFKSHTAKVLANVYKDEKSLLGLISKKEKAKIEAEKAAEEKRKQEEAAKIAEAQEKIAESPEQSPEEPANQEA